MRVISETSQYILTEYGGYHLKYELVEHTSSCEEDPEIFYGIRICQIEERDRRVFDFCHIRGITEELEAAKQFFRMAAEGLVMPVSLPEIFDDWQTSLAYT